MKDFSTVQVVGGNIMYNRQYLYLYFIISIFFS